VINLNDILDPSWYDWYGGSPNWSILPKPGHYDKIYDILWKASQTMPFTIYKRQEIPEHYHYSRNRRILPLFLVADEGWDVFQNVSQVHKPKGWPVWGNHGWDNRLLSMRPLFMANGPAFKSRYYHNRVFLNTDLFPLMLRILGLPLKPFPSDGSLDSVIDLLGNNQSNHSIRQLLNNI
jgi:ectonucleotide pyrophosphatase/phosphodiesterase family protein 5